MTVRGRIFLFLIVLSADALMTCRYMAVKIDFNVFRSTLIGKRVEDEERMAEMVTQCMSVLPLRSNFQVGNDSFTVYTLDLVRDTGERFLHSILQTQTQTQPSSPKRSECSDATVSEESNAIMIERSDAPAAAYAFKLMKLDDVPLLRVNKLIELIQTLAFFNAWAALEALAAAVEVQHTISLINVLAASIKITHTSVLATTLALALDNRAFTIADCEHAWATLGDVVTPAFCTKMIASSEGEAATWLWFTLSALSPHDDCIERSASGSAEIFFTAPRGKKVGNEDRGQHMFGHLSRMQDAFFKNACGKPWCACCSKVMGTLLTTYKASLQDPSSEVLHVY